MEAITRVSESDSESMTFEDQQIAQLVKRAIRIAGHSQAKVAIAIGVSRATMTRRLRAEAPFTAKELMRLARFLGIELSAFDPSHASAA